MFPDLLRSLGVLDSLDHRRVVGSIGEVDASGELGSEGGKSRVVGDVAGGEDEGCWFPVKGRELVLESEMEGVVSGDVTGSSGSATVLGEGTSAGKRGRKGVSGVKKGREGGLNSRARLELTSWSRRRQDSCSFRGSRWNTRR